MTKKNARGQVAIEYLVLIIFLLGIVSLAAGYALFIYYDTVRVNQARNVVFQVGKAADQVYSLGPGNSLVIEVMLPAGIETGSNTFGKEITYKVNMHGSPTDFIYETKGDLTPGDLPINEGVHHIEIKVVDANITINEI